MPVTVDFPSSLPCVSRIDGFGMTSSSAVLRTPPEAGSGIQRRTNNIMPTQIQIAWRTNNAQLQPLLSWLNEFGYDWFNVSLSGIESSELGEFSVPIAVRLMSDLTTSLMRVHRQNWWIISCSAEYQASVEVLNLPDIGTPSTNVAIPVIDDATHAHTADAITLGTPISALAIAQATHAHTADNIDLAQSETPLIVQDAAHVHTADNLSTTTSEVLLAIQDASHAHIAEGLLVLVSQTVLAPSDGAHAHTADNMTLEA